jgi:hypothetical protein
MEQAPAPDWSFSHGHFENWAFISGLVVGS